MTLHFPSVCLIVYAVQPHDDPAGISYGYAAGRYGAGYHAACPDGAAASYGHSGQDDGSASDPDIVLYPDRQGVCAADAALFPVLYQALPYVGGVRSRVDLHVGRYHHPVPDINPVVVHKGAVHIDDDAVAQEDILPVLAMEIDVHMDSLADTAKHLAQQTEPACGVSIIGSIELGQQAFCPYGHCRQLRVAADERLSRHAFLIFCLHR